MNQVLKDNTIDLAHGKIITMRTPYGAAVCELLRTAGYTAKKIEHAPEVEISIDVTTKN